MSKVQPKEVSEDKRRKEQILFKKEEKLHIGKTVKKTKKSIIVIHWKENKHIIEDQSFTKCERCNIGSFNNNDCLISINYREWHQVIDSLGKDEKALILKAPISAFIETREVIEDSNFRQELKIEITANSLESAIIQNLIKEEKIKEELVDAYEKLRKEKVIQYYTDGALGSNSKKAATGRMGIGWIVKEEGVADRNISFSSSLENWPSST